jgi:hypothetical protein
MRRGESGAFLEFSTAGGRLCSQDCLSAKQIAAETSEKSAMLVLFGQTDIKYNQNHFK